MHDLTVALRGFQEALALQTHRLGCVHRDVSDSLHGIGKVLYHQGQFFEARQALQRALSIRTTLLDPDHSDVQRSHIALALILQAEGYVDQYALAIIHLYTLSTHHINTLYHTSHQHTLSTSPSNPTHFHLFSFPSSPDPSMRPLVFSNNV